MSCAGAQKVVGTGISTETLCIIVIIVRGNLTFKLFLQKTQLQQAVGRFHWALELGAELPTHHA